MSSVHSLATRMSTLALCRALASRMTNLFLIGQSSFSYRVSISASVFFAFAAVAFDILFRCPVRCGMLACSRLLARLDGLLPFSLALLHSNSCRLIPSDCSLCYTEGFTGASQGCFDNSPPGSRSRIRFHQRDSLRALIRKSLPTVPQFPPLGSDACVLAVSLPGLRRFPSRFLQTKDLYPSALRFISHFPGFLRRHSHTHGL